MILAKWHETDCPFFEEHQTIFAKLDIAPRFETSNDALWRAWKRFIMVCGKVVMIFILEGRRARL